jgi:hypothetical protein
MMTISPVLARDITPEGPDYDVVRNVIELITEDYRDQPSLEAIAERLAQSPTQLQKTFRCSKPRSRSACRGRAGCTICSSPMRRCRRANGRRGAAA